MIGDKNYKSLIVRLIDGTTVKGSANIKEFNRVSDFLNKSEDRFLILFDVTTPVYEGHTLLINMGQIMWAMPGDSKTT